MTTATVEDAATIEREIRRTQDSMSSTVDKIGEQLSIKNVFNALLDKADQSNIDARMLVDGARRNPVALGLIAAGAIWLVSDKDSKLPTMPRKSDEAFGFDLQDFDVDHRDYVSHMSAIEMRNDEDGASFHRRRDLARSNFFMMERNHDEDETSFRQRLDMMTEKFRNTRRAWADSSNNMQNAARAKAKAASTKAQELYLENRVVGVIVAAAIGAAFGSALPVTRQEKDALGSLGQKARDVVTQRTEQVTAQVRETKDALLDKADAALNPSTNSDAQSQAPMFAQEHEHATPFMAGR